MQVVIDIPDEQIAKSLEESKYIHEDDDEERGFIDIALIYTNKKLEFVVIERKNDFYPLRYIILSENNLKMEGVEE